jgi:hypothetical protein
MCFSLKMPLILDGVVKLVMSEDSASQVSESFFLAIVLCIPLRV